MSDLISVKGRSKCIENFTGGNEGYDQFILCYIQIEIDYFQVIFYLAHDLKSLLEFIRRIREEGCWSINGLYFYDVSWQDLFGRDSKHPSGKR